jgi:hypothetical protein
MGRKSLRYKYRQHLKSAGCFQVVFCSNQTSGGGDKLLLAPVCRHTREEFSIP